MNKKNLKYIPISLLSAFLALEFPAFSQETINNILNKITLQRTQKHEVTLYLHANKKFVSEPILFEKNKNVYFISLPSTEYKGHQNVDISRFKSEISSLTVEYVPYQTVKNSGYTRIVINTNNDVKLLVKERAGFSPKNAIGVVFKILGSMVALVGIVYGSILVWSRIRKRKDVDDVLALDDDYKLEYVDDQKTPYSDAISREDYRKHEAEKDNIKPNYPSLEEMVIDILKSDETLEALSEKVIEKTMSNSGEKTDNYEVVENLDAVEELHSDDQKKTSVDENIETVSDDELSGILEDNDLEDFTDTDTRLAEDLPENDKNDGAYKEVDVPLASSASIFQTKPIDFKNSSENKSDDTIEQQTDSEQEFSLPFSVTVGEIPTPEEISLLEKDFASVEQENLELADDNFELEGEVENLEEVASIDNSINIVDGEKKDIVQEEAEALSKKAANEDEIDLNDFADAESDEEVDPDIAFFKQFETDNKPEQSVEASSDNKMAEDADSEDPDIAFFKQFETDGDDANEKDNTVMHSDEGSDNDSEVDLFERFEKENKEAEENAEFDDDEVPIADNQESDDLHVDEKENVAFEHDDASVSVNNLDDIDFDEEERSENVSSEFYEDYEEYFDDEEQNRSEDDRQDESSEEDIKEVIKNNLFSRPINTASFFADDPFDEEDVAKETEEEKQVDTTSFFADTKEVVSKTKNVVKAEKLDETILPSFFKEQDVIPAVKPNLKQFVLPALSKNAIKNLTSNNIEPIVVSGTEFAENKKLYLLRQNNNYSLVAIVNDNVSVLNRFDRPPRKSDITIKFNEKRDDSDIWLANVDTWRALISVNDNKAENILTLS